jgi:hypothetical protein
MMPDVNAECDKSSFKIMNSAGYSMISEKIIANYPVQR